MADAIFLSYSYSMGNYLHSHAATVMDPQMQSTVADRPCPMMFVVLPAFVGALIWLCVLLNRISP
jgi:hypothetical protein